jgi:hypothetical protein
MARLIRGVASSSDFSNVGSFSRTSPYDFDRRRASLCSIEAMKTPRCSTSFLARSVSLSGMCLVHTDSQAFAISFSRGSVSSGTQAVSFDMLPSPTELRAPSLSWKTGLPSSRSRNPLDPLKTPMQTFWSAKDPYCKRVEVGSLSRTGCPVCHEAHAPLLRSSAPRFSDLCCFVESSGDCPVELPIDSRPSLSAAVVKGIVDRVRTFLDQESAIVPKVLQQTHTFDSASSASSKTSSSRCLISSASFSGCCEMTTCIISDIRYLLSSFKNL